MTYGLDTRAFIEDGPVHQVAKRPQARSWRVLDERRRIALVEQALVAANDGFPAAL